MLRISLGTTSAKTRRKWLWNAETDKIEFTSPSENTMYNDKYVETNGFKFLKNLNDAYEDIFRQEFQRDDNTYDADVILIQDIINLVLFLAPPEMITKKFVCFLNTKTVTMFLHALIIYFENFLRIVEFLLIRRDEISSSMARMQSIESVKMKQIYSSHLSQYRLLLAREYSKILLGEGSMKYFHHYNFNLHVSNTIADRTFHEFFLAFSTQAVWIAMHRRAYYVIEMEMGRLFRSEHFSLHAQDEVKFSEAERKVLYGKHYKRVNYRIQNSPIVQEISSVATVDLPILMIGEQKYRGTDLRVLELELEYLVPSSQLVLINKVHGILGHPKTLYNTGLELDWNAVRKRHYDENYDPFNIIKQPRLRIPNLNEEDIREQSKEYGAYYKIKHLFEPWKDSELSKWIHREDIVNHFNTKGIIKDVIVKCKEELAKEYKTIDVKQITQQFIERVEKLQKIH